MSIRKHPENRFSTNLIIPSADSLKALAVVTVAENLLSLKNPKLVHLS